MYLTISNYIICNGLLVLDIQRYNNICNGLLCWRDFYQVIMFLTIVSYC